jgi:hypothetical protein
MSTHDTQTDKNEQAKGPKRIPASSLKFQFAGDMVMVRNPDRNLSGLFRRYEALLEMLANMDREERLLNYRFMIGLILTSHAKKVEKLEDKKRLFDMKNKMFIRIANDRSARKFLAFKYLVSKNFRVIDFCESCVKTNTDAGNKRHNWKFCDKCKLDRDFYNVLSMHHKFKDGYMTLYLSNDLIEQIKGLNVKRKGKLEDTKEEASFERYHYNVRNLDAFDLETTLTWYEKLIK